MNWTLFCLGLISVAVVIPFIYRAQHNIVKIVLLFLGIPRKEIVAKIAGYQRMKQQIDAHFMQIKKLYAKTNFCLDQQTASESAPTKQAKKQQKRKESTPTVNEPQAETATTTPDTVPEEKKTQQEEEGKLERESKSREIAAKSKTSFCRLLLKTSVTALLFLAYALLQHFLRDAFFQKAQFSLNMLNILLSREPYVSEGMTFLIEEVVQGTAQLSSTG